MSHKKQKKRIRVLAKRWLKPLGLLYWGVEIYYDEDRTSFVKNSAIGPHGEVRRETLMVVQADWRYKRAYLRVNIGYLPEFDDKELEHYFVHELCHILVNEMSVDNDCLAAHEERVVTGLAEAFIWVREAGMKEGEKSA